VGEKNFVCVERLSDSDIKKLNRADSKNFDSMNSNDYTQKNGRRIINPSKGFMGLINPFIYGFWVY
jgi:hypothetical protein